MAKAPWESDYERSERDRKETADRELRYLGVFLQQLGVKTITAKFDGEGDSGEITELLPDPKPMVGLPFGMEDTLKDCLVEHIPGGWELDAGSLGEVQFDVATGECRCHIDYRFDDDFDGEWE